MSIKPTYISHILSKSNIHDVLEADYPFVWNPRPSFVRRMEMSTVCFNQNHNISVFSWQPETPHNEPLRRQQDKGARTHWQAHNTGMC